MGRIFYLLIFFLLLLGFNDFTKEQDPFYEFEIVRDKDGLPDSYIAYIKSPVCEKDKCYEIEINMQWDLIGRFQEYDTLSGKGLTKLDHIPFNDQDYQKLSQLLKDPNSPIGAYRKEELILDTRRSEIDGFTGATIREINDIVVGGGVYSCYTLWQLANRKFTDSISKMTISSLDKKLMKKLVSMKDQGINHFIFKNLGASDFLKYRDEVLKLIVPHRGYFAKNAIEKMPKHIFKDSITQAYFAEHFSSFNYFTQLALLKQLNTIPLTPAMKNALLSQKENRNSLKNKLIQNLIQ